MCYDEVMFDTKAVRSQKKYGVQVLIKQKAPQSGGRVRAHKGLHLKNLSVLNYLLHGEPLVPRPPPNFGSRTHAFCVFAKTKKLRKAEDGCELQSESLM